MTHQGSCFGSAPHGSGLSRAIKADLRARRHCAAHKRALSPNAHLKRAGASTLARIRKSCHNGGATFSVWLGSVRRGGFGNFFEAKDTLLGRQCAHSAKCRGLLFLCILINYVLTPLAPQKRLYPAFFQSVHNKSFHKGQPFLPVGTK